jgi:hypothetical protein
MEVQFAYQNIRRRGSGDTLEMTNAARRAVDGAGRRRQRRSAAISNVVARKAINGGRARRRRGAPTTIYTFRGGKVSATLGIRLSYQHAHHRHRPQ